MFIDTHSHLIWKELEDRQDTVIKDAIQAGIGYCITIGCDLLTTKKSLECAQQFSSVFFTAGIHPSECQESIDWDTFLQYAQHEKCVGIGETGFDFYHSTVPKELQEVVFMKQIEIADRLKKPLIIHTRQASDDTLRMLKQHTPQKFVIHCFTENLSFANEIIKIGGYFSVGGILTYKNAQELRDTVKQIPLEHIMLETDCPYLAPQSVRGKVNEPKYLLEIALKLADIHQVSLDTIENSTTKNAQRFFGIK